MNGFLELCDNCRNLIVGSDGLSGFKSLLGEDIADKIRSFALKLDDIRRWDQVSYFLYQTSQSFSVIDWYFRFFFRFSIISL